MNTRPFHPDEANQAYTAGQLLETGVYRYNPADHHGPVLYYAAVPVLRASGAQTFAEMDGAALRSVPLLFALLAALGVVLLPRGSKGFFRTWWGRLAALAFLVTAPAFVYFSTFFIQEMLLAAFLAVMLLAAARYVAADNNKARSRWAIVFGAAAGLAFATKETSVLSFAAALGAFCILHFARRPQPSAAPHSTFHIQHSIFNILLAAAAAFAMAVLFFSSFGTNLHGVYDAFIAAPASYLHRAVGDAVSAGAAAHVHPWWWYLRILFTWHTPGGTVYTEAALLVAAAFGLLLRPRNRWAVFMALYTALLLVFYSAIPYKTPWCVLTVVEGLAVTAALGLDAVAAADTFSRTRRRALGLFLALLCLVPHGFNVVDELHRPVARTCPFAYAAASPDIENAAALIESTLKSAPAGSFAAVALPSTDTWPLPWYLRRVPAGYWQSLDLIPLGLKPAAVIVPEELSDRASQRFPELTGSGIYGLRPGVLITVLYREDGQ